MSLLNVTTPQNPTHKTEIDKEHAPIVRKISDHEIEVTLEGEHPMAEDHYIEYISLYCNRKLVDVIYLKPGDLSRVIFDLNKINEREKKRVEGEELFPELWSINDIYHAVIRCSIHGNWSDVMEELL